MSDDDTGEISEQNIGEMKVFVILKHKTIWKSMYWVKTTYVSLRLKVGATTSYGLAQPWHIVSRNSEEQSVKLWEEDSKIHTSRISMGLSSICQNKSTLLSHQKDWFHQPPISCNCYQKKPTSFYWPSSLSSPTLQVIFGERWTASLSIILNKLVSRGEPVLLEEVRVLYRKV